MHYVDHLDIMQQKIKVWEYKACSQTLGISFSRIWHIDEMFIKANGKMNYLYAVIDDKSQVIALYVSEKRNIQSAILCLRKARYIAGKPEITVTDGWQAYPKGCKECIRKGEG